MNFDQLRVFIAVAERGHMTRASEALGLSQSAVSAAVRGLEASFGVRLFDRVGRNIELSRAGKRFLPEAKAVMDRVAAARLAIDHISHHVAGNISIAASQTIASYWLPDRLTTFHNAYPAVRLDVTIGNTRQVELSVLDGSADIGLVEGRPHSELLRRTRVATDRLVLISRTVIPPDNLDLESYQWVIRERGSGTLEVLEDLLARSGKGIEDLQVVLVFPSNEAVLRAVAAGAGVTLISERVARDAIGRGAVYALSVPSPERDFVLIAHADRHPLPAATALKRHLAQNALE